MTLGLDFELDTLTHDLKLSDGDISVVSSVAQAIKIRLLLVQGEWFRDVSIGVPYYESVFIKPVNTGLLSSVFHDAIVNTLGVNDVISLDVLFDSSTRSVSIEWTADTDEGEISDTQVLTV